MLNNHKKVLKFAVKNSYRVLKNTIEHNRINTKLNGVSMADIILAIDQGTTSTRSIIFDKNLRVVQSSQREITQYFPKPGWVEHDPEEIFDTVIDTVKEVIKKTGITVKEIVSIGITNQSETTIIWDAILIIMEV